ncbi:MAG: BrnA antitoxin family protein [Pleurocapsa sp. SU_196_0]|nr:BrnA antitoxin family protein [Pleurocapsa sp. SU_196_0]
MTSEQQALERLANLPDADIDLSDLPEQLDWNDAERGKFYRPVKQSVTMRVDADVLAWFKANSEKYQSRINEVLREFVQEQRKARGMKR